MEISYFKPHIQQAEIDEVVDTLKSNWLTTGPKTKQFETDFANYLGHKHAIAVNSCTAAMHLALEAVGVKEGDAVLVPTLTFAATAEVVRYLNATPILVDCRTNDFNMDLADAERRLLAAREAGQKVTAIMPMHYGGQVGDMKGTVELARKYDLKIVEDAAHCCPTYYRDKETDDWKSVGADGDVSCYSFYANKTITTGEGGIACTDDDELAKRMRTMSLHGLSRDAWNRHDKRSFWYYEIVAPGFKYNLTDIAASLGIHQIRKADTLHRERTRLAELYTQRLEGIEEIVLPQSQPNRIHSWHLYVIRILNSRLTISRDDFLIELKKHGIGTTIHWMPLHLHPYYQDHFGYRPEDLPNATSLYDEIISIPIYPGLQEEELNYVVQTIKNIITKNKIINIGFNPMLRATS